MKTTMTPPNLKSCLALAALGLACAGAAAQSSVTIYGNVDLGLMTGNNDTQNQVYNGGISPSIWGFRGTEDLGGGLKASFNLEAHFDADTGAQVGGMFRRQSNIALSSASLGTLTLGNMYSPAVLAFAATDPRGLRENFSGLYPWAYNSGALITGSTNTDVGVFVKNAVAYSNNFGPVGVSVSYSVAENAAAAGPTAAKGGAVTALGLTYSGPVTLSAAYQEANAADTSTEASKMYSVGAGYTMGAITAKVNYLNGVNKTLAGVETNDVGIFGLGLDWKTSSANTVIAAFYRGKDDKVSNSTTSTFILADEYALSKRTTLYGQLAFANADSNAGLRTSVIAGGTTADKNTSLLNVGIKHSF
jgi:predicted porin